MGIRNSNRNDNISVKSSPTAEDFYGISGIVGLKWKTFAKCLMFCEKALLTMKIVIFREKVYVLFSPYQQRPLNIFESELPEKSRVGAC
jgi:hypothetical protein